MYQSDNIYIIWISKLHHNSRALEASVDICSRVVEIFSTLEWFCERVAVVQSLFAAYVELNFKFR